MRHATVVPAPPAGAPAAAAEPVPTKAPAIVDHLKKVPRFDLARAMRQVAAEGGRGHVAQALEISRLYLGPGGITPFEYYYYRLHDDRLPPAAKRAFVGDRLRVKVTRTVLDHHHYGIGLDKLLFHACMTGLGLPVPRLLAVVHPRRKVAGCAHLEGPAAFAAFLRDPANLPAFCKPAEQTASLGAAAVLRHHLEDDTIELGHGLRCPVAELVAATARYLDRGYLVQELLRPHAESAAIAGARLATLRLLVLTPEGEEPQAIGATWRLPLGRGLGDVHWRGNMMAALDPQDGTILRVVRGSGASLQVVERHPETGAHLPGLAVPHWPAARALALEAARAVPGLALTGWDVAITPAGPILVELEPDGGSPTVIQLASGQGLLAGPYGDYLRARGVLKTAGRR